VSSSAGIPVRIGTTDRNCVQTRDASHGEMRGEARQRPVVLRSAQAALPRLHGLPLAVVEQPVDELTRAVPLRLSAEAQVLSHGSLRGPTTQCDTVVFAR